MDHLAVCGIRLRGSTVGRATRLRDNEVMRWIVACAVGLVLMPNAACRKPPSAGDQVERRSSSAAESPAVVWETSWNVAFERAHRERKPVVVAFHADWSAWSVHMAGSVLREPSLGRVLAESAVPLRVEVTGDGRERAQQHRVEHLPTVLVFSPAGVELERLVGVCRAEDIEDAIGRAVAAAEP
jgi:thiol:disulfide interchange protein